MKVRLGAAVVAALTMTACGGSGKTEQGTESAVEPSSSSPTATASEEPTPEGLTDEQIEKYLENLFSEQPRLITKAGRMAAPGSVADAYAAYRLEVANSNLDGGYPQDAQQVSMGSEEARVCSRGADASCSTVANFKSEGDKLVSFTVDGKRLEKRLVAGDRKVQPVPGAGNVEFLVGYKTASDDHLIVAVRFEAGDQALNIWEATYRAKDGRQSTSTNISGPTTLAAKSSATYTMAFPNAAPGGTATLRSYIENGPDVEAVVEVR